MKIAHVTAELSPIAKTGGLGEAVAALVQGQRLAGDEVRVVMPAYPRLLREGFARIGTLSLGSESVELYSDPDERVWLIGLGRAPPELGGLYEGLDARDFLRFGLAAAEALKLFAPDVVHAHDWHAGAAVYAWKGRCVFTVHNPAFQGLLPLSQLRDAGIEARHLGIDGFEFWGQASLLKGGLVFSDACTTVSPSYAKQLLQAPHGFGLEGVFASLGEAFCGVLNGLDESRFSPVDKPSAKSELLRCLDIPGDPWVLGCVSRLSAQKGIDTLLEAMALVRVEPPMVLVIHGDGDRALEQRALGAAQPGRLVVRLGYEDTLARAIFGGADAVVVPSRFEPCGMAQLIGLRYGAVPIVMKTGGLSDTVTDVEHRGNGFVFEPHTPQALAEAIERARDAFEDRARWAQLVARGQGEDHGARAFAQRYDSVYRRALEAQ